MIFRVIDFISKLIIAKFYFFLVEVLCIKIISVEICCLTIIELTLNLNEIKNAIIFLYV